MTDNNPLTRDKILGFLAEQGYKTTIDRDEDIIFKGEGRTFVIYSPLEDDPMYFNMSCFFNFTGIVANAEQAYYIANWTNREFKAVKVNLVEDHELDKPNLRMAFAVECFFRSFDEFALTFERMISALNSGIEACLGYIKELNQQLRAE